MSKADSGTDGNSGNAGGGGEPFDGAIDPATLGAGGGADADGFDPAIHVARDKRNGDGSFTRKRGRKSGTSTGAGSRPNSSKASAADLKAAVDVLSGTLQLLHVTASSVFHAPELELSSQESDSLAKATVNVMEQFDLKPDPKTQALAGLIMVAGTIYGPRIYLIQARRKDEAEARRTGSGTVTTANGAPAGTTEYKVQ